MPPLPPDATIMQVLPRLEAGGVERGTVEITQAIAAAGGRPLVVSAGGRLVPAIERAGGGHLVLPLASKNPVTIWRNAARLHTATRLNDVSLVHARSRAPAWSAYYAARRAGLPFVTTYHAPYTENAPGKRLYNSVMARGDRVIAISRHIANLVVERHQVDPAIVRIIPRGVDPVLFDPARIVPDRIARLMRAWRLPDGAPVVMLPARLTRWKGQAVLLRAMALLQHTDAVCVLLGEGRPAFVQELTHLAHSLGIADRLRFAGHCDDMPAALMLATVAVSASTEPEGFGRAVIEAQAMGCAVIATNHGGAAETVENLVTGWHVPPADPAALAQILDHALAMTREDRAGLGERARASVLANYTVTQMQAATIAVYNELL
jgi:glycosyltransferase involved in cell wall biosynthesis